jgi:hypothetical protein
VTETSARVIAHSAHPYGGPDLITVEVILHRFVLAELNTHRVFSRNSASSRAIPVDTMIGRIAGDAAWPVSWPAEQPGMQGGAELEGVDLLEAQEVYDDVRRFTRSRVSAYVENHPDREHRLHKSVLNRLLEPFLWHTVIITATEWDNFFGLRCHPLAQPEIRLAAEKIREAIEASTPAELQGDRLGGDWHAPYATSTVGMTSRLIESAARCAWVSTASHDGDHSYEACERMVRRLATAEPMHASPFEHQARPMLHEPKDVQIGNLRGWRQLRHEVEFYGLGFLGLEAP